MKMIESKSKILNIVFSLLLCSFICVSFIGGVALNNIITDNINITIIKAIYLIVTTIGIVNLLVVFHIYILNVVNTQKIVDASKKVLEEQGQIKLVEAQAKAKSDFLANMSHEIRTPINTILGMNEMILREAKQNNIQLYAQDIKSAGDILLYLINDILDFSKIESGQIQLYESDYSTQVLLNDINNMINVKAETKGLKYSVHLSSNIPQRLNGDKVRVQQIAINLLTNAIKYTEHGYVIFTVAWEDRTKELKLRVTDSGRGIKEEDIKTLYDRFQRVDLKHTNNIEGTGLGLAITKALVDKMGGTIEVESVYGTGSTFIVTLPQKALTTDCLDVNLKPIQREHNEYTVKFTARDARILAIDDTPLNLVVIERLLAETHIQIDKAERAAEGLDKLRLTKEPYDLILMDIRMPSISGEEALEIIKRDNLAPNTPIVALTADALSESEEKYLSQGFSDYLTKPVNPEKLEETVLKYLPKTKVAYHNAEFKAIQINKEDAVGIFNQLLNYTKVQNDTAIQSMLDALSKYKFAEGNQYFYDRVKEAFENRNYNEMEKLLTGEEY